MQKYLAFRTYNPSAGLLRKIEFCSYEQCKNQKDGRNSLLCSNATPVHTEDRAAVVTLKTVILFGPSKGNFVNPPDDNQVQFTVKSSLGRGGFTSELAQFCEISLLNVLLCFI